jgi:homotetrameric cytidine deaminase
MSQKSAPIENLEALVGAAIAARGRAYAPYSKFYVGAALRLRDGRIVSGANVENCSYGLSFCAERSAVVAAVAQGMRPGDVVAVAVAAQADDVTAPCGACRQVLAEFAAEGTQVVLHNVQNAVRKTYALTDLLPHAFTPASLARLP